MDSAAKGSPLFGGLDLTTKPVADRSRNKFDYRIKKADYRFAKKYVGKREREKLLLLINDIPRESGLDVITNALDLIWLLNEYGPELKAVYVCSWTLTAFVVSALLRCYNAGCHNIHFLADKIHTYEWMVKEGSLDRIGDKVKFTWLKVHAKILALEFIDGRILTFSGSMNLSDNRFFENVRISTMREDFDFYVDFILNGEKWQGEDAKI